VCEVWYGGAALRTRRRQMAGLQSLLDWFSAHQRALTSIGAGLVVIIGGLWQLYVYLDAKKDKLNQTSRNPQPIVLPIVLPPTQAAPPADMQRTPLRVIVGRYRRDTYPKEARRSKIFNCTFTLVLSAAIFLIFFAATVNISTLLVFPQGLFVLPFVLVPMLLSYGGIAVFLSELTLLIGKVQVFAGLEMILISRSLGEIFTNHTIILASEWRFDGEVFVSRGDGTLTSLPDLPEYVRLELIKVLNEAWR